MLKRTSLAILVAVAACGDNARTNFPPVLTAQTIELTMVEDGTSTIDATATDPEADAITYAASAPSHGTLTGAGPIYTYKPAAAYVGSDELTITVSDGDNQLTVPVTITVIAADHAPVADAQAVSVDRNVAKAITLTGHDAATNDMLIFEIATPPAHGTLSGDAPDVIYTPNLGYYGADSFTFNATNPAVTSAAATVTITVVPVPVCGDGLEEASEWCDDGNDVNDDGCNSLCHQPVCGDGIIQLDQGEECDDGNTASGDGCDADCQSGAFDTVDPIVISGGDLCTTDTAGMSHKVGVDGSGNIYAIMKCGGEAEAATVVVSTDRGVSYHPPQKLVPSGELDTRVAIAAAGPTGVAYAAWIRDDNEVFARRTTDAGATWGATLDLGATSDHNAGLSLTAFNDHVFIAFQIGAGLGVVADHHQGAGPYTASTVALGISPIDLLYDPVTRLVVAAGDSPTFSIRASIDAGATFAAEVNPLGSEFFSDWAMANGRIFVGGSNLGGSTSSAALYVITTNPLASTPILGLPAITGPYARTLAADSHGNAFVASQLDGGELRLDRLRVDADGFDFERTIALDGASPSVGPLPGQHGAAIIYMDSSFQVWASVQSYDGPQCAPAQPGGTTSGLLCFNHQVGR